MALDSAPLNPARRTVIIHDLETVGRTVNRPLQERFDIGLSPPAVVTVASRIQVHPASEGDRRAG
jgi:hypothetical protein